MEVLGRHSVTIVDGTNIVSDIHRVKGHGAITVSGAVLHVLSAGNRFDTDRAPHVAERVVDPRCREAEETKVTIEIRNTTVFRGPQHLGPHAGHPH